MIKKSQVQRTIHTVLFKCTVKRDEKARLEAYIDGSNRVYAFESENLAEVALNKPLDDLRLIEQLSKLGGTPFHVGKIEILLEENLSVPISALNMLRRKCLDAILEDLRVRYKSRVKHELKQSSKNELSIKHSSHNASKTIKPTLMLVFDSAHHLIEAMSEKHKIQNTEHNQSFEIDFYLTDLDGYAVNLEALKREGVVPVLPRIIRHDETQKVESFLKSYATSDARICLSHIGQLELVKELPFSLIADYSINAFNSLSGEALKALGFDQIVWSTELSKDELKKINQISESNIS